MSVGGSKNNGKLCIGGWSALASSSFDIIHLPKNMMVMRHRFKHSNGDNEEGNFITVDGNEKLKRSLESIALLAVHYVRIVNVPRHITCEGENRCHCPDKCENKTEKETDEEKFAHYSQKEFTPVDNSFDQINVGLSKLDIPFKILMTAIDMVINDSNPTCISFFEI